MSHLYEVLEEIKLIDAENNQKSDCLGDWVVGTE